MSSQRKLIPPYLKRSLAVLIIFLMGISIARLLVTMHQQEERIEILEGTVAQLLADTSRLAIPTPPRPFYRDDRSYEARPSGNYQQQHSNAYHRSQHSTQASSSAQHDNASHTASSPAPSSSPQAVSNPASTGSPSAEARSHKFTSPHLFDLNTIDSLTLIRIPGIAGRTASVILRKRLQYGGFHTPRQLQEFLTWDTALDYMDEWCTRWFTADASRLRTLPINTATISDLQRHPYISHEQAVEITHYRTRHKGFTSATELQQLSTFTPEQLQMLLPYLSFGQ